MKIFRSRHFRYGLLAASGFLPLLFLPTAYMFDLVNALTVAVGVGVLAAYGPGVWRSYQQDEWGGGHYLVLGIAVTWIATTLRHMWNWAWRFAGKPDAMIDHPAVAFLVFLAMLGGTLHLAASGAIDGDIPRRNWLRLGIALAVGLALAFIVIVFLEPVIDP